MKISPNYKYKHICHFCKKKIAINGKELTRELYYVVKAAHYVNIYHSSRYYELTVAIPTCKECYEKNTKIFRICFFIGLLIFFCSAYYFSGAFAESDHRAVRSLEDVLIACLPSILIAFLLGRAIAYFIRMLLEAKWHINSFCDDYAPIKKLVDIGFEPSDTPPNLKDPELQGKGPLESRKLNKAIADIITNEHCIFEN